MNELIPQLPLLEEMPRPPRKLYYRGDARLLSAPSLAIVGTRRPSAYGLRAATLLARELAAMGFAIVSGLARGIDAAAHRGALAVQGKTIAVLGHGLDRIYPPEHAGLAEEIVERGGVLLSEYPPETPPLRHHFPERNRIIAGLALGTVVVEAAEKSGSLSTARHALDANRDVFAVPGPFDDVGFLGGHRLLQEGAKLVVCASDIAAEIEPPGGIGSFGVATLPPSVALLAKAFATLGPAATLEEIFCETKLSLVDIRGALELAVASGIVEEIGPQRFLWLGGVCLAKPDPTKNN